MTTLTMMSPTPRPAAKERSRPSVLMPKKTAERIRAQLRPRPLAQAIHSHRATAISAPTTRITVCALSA